LHPAGDDHGAAARLPFSGMDTLIDLVDLAGEAARA
jgi:hypothetical protein